MGKGIVGLDQAYQAVFVAALIFLAVMLILCLVRAIIGPRDRGSHRFRQHDGYNGHGHHSNPDRDAAGRVSGGYLYYLCDDQFSCSDRADQVYMGVYQEKKQREEKEDGGI